MWSHSTFQKWPSSNKAHNISPTLRATKLEESAVLHKIERKHATGPRMNLTIKPLTRNLPYKNKRFIAFGARYKTELEGQGWIQRTWKKRKNRWSWCVMIIILVSGRVSSKNRQLFYGLPLPFRFCAITSTSSTSSLEVADQVFPRPLIYNMTLN